MASVKPFGKKAVSFAIEQLGNDKRVVREAKEYMESFDVWVTYYGKSHDLPLLNTRLLKWNLPPVSPRPHIDLYYQLKYKLRMGRRSQAHLLSFLSTPEQKMSVSPDVWASLASNFKTNLKILIERCESDVKGLEDLYKRTRHLIINVTR